MSILITVALCALAAYLGWRFGRRKERGLIERERDEAMERAAQRGERHGSIRMNTIQFRR